MIRIIGDDGFYLRAMDDMLDQKWFYECMRDWPADHDGIFTKVRADKVCSKHYAANQRAHFPLVDHSKYRLTMVYCNSNDEQIGYRRAKITGTNTDAIVSAKRWIGARLP